MNETQMETESAVVPSLPQEVITKLEKRLHHCRKELTRSAKKARAFVIQKLVKKIRFAKTKTENSTDAPPNVQETRKKELQKFETDYADVKALDLNHVATTALLKIVRTSNLPHKDQVLLLCGKMDIVEPTLTLDESRAAERLLRHEELIRETAKSLDDLATTIAKADGQKMRKEIVESGDEHVEEFDPQPVVGTKRKLSSAVNNEVLPTKKKLRQSSPVEGEEEVDQPVMPRAEKLKPIPKAVEKRKAKPAKISRSAEDRATSKKESISGSDQEEAPQKKEKNRMGQRARRQLWEKEYGNRAKHLQVIEHVMVANKIKKEREARAKEAVEDLHPSWQAKKAARASIKPFEGKKITFGDDDDISAPLAKKGAKADNGGDLHPSWQAKKAANARMAAFQGKKMTFDDDSANTFVAKKGPLAAKDKGKKVNEESDAGLHPSWLAKKKQREAISAAPAGKKITFD
ncbi:hypothetical protein HDU76_000992 [Blyttiomyces sp. JEL0837]|nr:hypothetical protein HDU76_000992 [Blyttiomyces sp. JEL0837]